MSTRQTDDVRWGWDGHLQELVTDDGLGLDPTHRSNGLGLRGIDERVRELAGTMTISQEDVRQLQQRGLTDSYHLLTDREKEVLQLLAEGRSNKEVATLLDLGLSTVETHRANLMQKLNLHNTAEIRRVRQGVGPSSLLLNKLGLPPDGRAQERSPILPAGSPQWFRAGSGRG